MQQIGFVVQIVTNGVLDATALETYGPCDALKSDESVTIAGVPRDNASAETVTGFPVPAGGQWDETGWAAISGVTGAASTHNVWAGWERRVKR